MDIFYTLHAQQTMAARGVSREEVEQTLARPEITYRGNSDNDAALIYQRGTMGVVAVPGRGGLVVITVLWRRVEDWSSDEMKEGRK